MGKLKNLVDFAKMKWAPEIHNKVDGEKIDTLFGFSNKTTPDQKLAMDKITGSHLSNPKSQLARDLSEVSEGRLSSQSITDRWNSHFKKLRKAGEPIPSNEELVNIFRNPDHPTYNSLYRDIEVKPKFSKGANTYLERQGLLKPENTKKGYSKYQLMNDRFSGIKDMDANKFSDLVEKNTVDGLGIDLIDNPDPTFLNLGGKKYVQGDNVFFLDMKDLDTDAGRVRQNLDRSGLNTQDWESLSVELKDYITKHQVGRRAPRHLRDEVNQIIAEKFTKDLGV